MDFKLEPKDLKFDVFRASGAGGQHVNTTESAVRCVFICILGVIAGGEERTVLMEKQGGEVYTSTYTHPSTHTNK